MKFDEKEFVKMMNWLVKATERRMKKLSQMQDNRRNYASQSYGMAEEDLWEYKAILEKIEKGKWQLKSWLKIPAIKNLWTKWEK